MKSLQERPHASSKSTTHGVGHGASTVKQSATNVVKIVKSWFSKID